MKLIYTAGPFTAPTREGILDNIRRAADVGHEVRKRGGYAVVPHLIGVPYADGRLEDCFGYEWWIQETLALLCMCEALILVPGWEQSSGARGEVRAAQERGMPVFQPGDYEGLAWWLRGSAETLPPPLDAPAVPVAEHPCQGCECGVPVRNGMHEEDTGIPNMTYVYPCTRDDRVVPVAEAKRMIARGEPMPMRVSFADEPDSLTACDEEPRGMMETIPEVSR